VAIVKHFFNVIVVVLAVSGIVQAQSASVVNTINDVTAQLTGAQRISLISSLVPNALLAAINITSRASGFKLAEVYVPQSQVTPVTNGLCSNRTGLVGVIRVYQLPDAPQQTNVNPVLSINRADDSSVLVQGPMLAGGVGETRITTGEVMISNAGTQLIGVFAQSAVLVHAC
jgi:hypothetical protein